MLQYIYVLLVFEPHVRCRHTALWVVRVLLVELSSIIDNVYPKGTRRFLIYVLPDLLSVELAKRSLQGGDIDFGDSIQLMAYTDLTKALSTSPLPDFVRSSVIVLDTDYGRISSQLVATMAELHRVWAQFKAKDEPFRGTAIAVSPCRDQLWSAEYIAKVFGTEILDIELTPKTRSNLVQNKRGGATQNVDMIADTILSLAHEKATATIVCAVPSRQGLGIQ